jgi:hypothetical protein
MTRQEKQKGDSLSWLLEPESPGVRYLALRDLVGLSPDDSELRAARKAAHQSSPIATILSKMDTSGFWCEPGPGYNPKYRSTVWSLILLAQLGASIHEDARIATACAYLLDHALTPQGQFTTSGAPSGTIHCLHGNCCWALLELGCEDARLAPAFEWMARSVTGEGIAPAEDRDATLRYYASSTCGPTFACAANNKLPCAWGAAKVMLAFGRLPSQRHTPVIKRAIKQGVDFLFSTDPAGAAYPVGRGEKPSQNWWKFGFPLFYVTDVLQLAEVLISLGYAKDARLRNTLALIRDEQDADSRWAQEYGYPDKTWVNFGAKKRPNKWVTLRAMRVMQATGYA